MIVPKEEAERLFEAAACEQAGSAPIIVEENIENQNITVNEAPAPQEPTANKWDIMRARRKPTPKGARKANKDLPEYLL